MGLLMIGILLKNPIIAMVMLHSKQKIVNQKNKMIIIVIHHLIIQKNKKNSNINNNTNNNNNAVMENTNNNENETKTNNNDTSTTSLIKLPNNGCCWIELMDPTSGQTYYFNEETNKSSWDMPLVEQQQ